MDPVRREELLGLAAYEEVRPHFRRRIIELKRLRRVPLGTNMSVLFENHDTVLFQIQEMLRTERLTKEAAIMHEIETYNTLVPRQGELSTTIFIEYPEAGERERMLQQLAGIEQRFYLLVGGERCACIGETRGERTDRTTAVQYVRFPLSAQAQQRFSTRRVQVSLGVNHPHYTAEAMLGDDVIESLRDDLA